MRVRFYFIAAIVILFFISCIDNKENIEPTTFIDSRDGQSYKIVKIGNQYWMAENLNFITDTGSYINDRNSNNERIYGRLYDWYTAKTAIPKGWHLPNNNDWSELITYLGGDSVAGYKLMGKYGWRFSSYNTDESGFSAVGGGNRSLHGFYSDFQYWGQYWSLTEISDTTAWILALYGNNRNATMTKSLKLNCFSIRCIKDL